MTAAVAAAVDHMWRRVLTGYGLPADGAAVAETDCMWKEILKVKGLLLDQVYERLDKDTVPLRIPSKMEEEAWVYDQKRKLGDAGYEEMMRKKGERFYKYDVAKDEMKKMLKKAAKKRKILEEQAALGLIYDKKKKKSEWLVRCTVAKYKKEKILKKEEKKKKNLEEQEALGLLYDKKKKTKNKRKRHGDDDDNQNKKKMKKRKRHGDDDDNQNKKKMKKATTTSSGS